ncbi:hypothetical protein K432DRAFT_413431 [Lepidopterella palustris CBS 459.81]|uniref:Nuclear distribution protein RO10 n=1 Tax=Lepidopterella palustris CBS 459.81 TaxID=1314670 RepID=A0A8E2JJZ6_9PEZI|nr:hypothetical protein K432DRAFT_413431 [Lepidopterella palustris CBS 459.81]
MAHELEQLVLQTLDLLEVRLSRIEFTLDGGISDDGSTPTQPLSVPERIQKLEESLQKFSRKTALISEVQRLQSQHPDLFRPASEAESRPDPKPSEQLAMVLTEAPAFPTTASQLTSLNDLPVPPTESFAALAALHPRIQEAEVRQTRQAMEISALRKRTGALVIRWNEIYILGQGKCWAEWDGRLRTAERAVRREEIRKSQENEA